MILRLSASITCTDQQATKGSPIEATVLFADSLPDAAMRTVALGRIVIKSPVKLSGGQCALNVYLARVDGRQAGRSAAVSAEATS